MACILIIDDDPAVQLSIQLSLEREGHRVVCASDGEQGLRAFASKAPDLVVTDLIMPNKEGIETIMQIRASDGKTPILAISGGGRLSNADFLKMAAKVGANAILPKPFEAQDLVAAVRRLLSS
jgi:DNA-binding response OmpR family regulator